MTNKDKILRYLECGLKVLLQSANGTYPAFTISDAYLNPDGEHYFVCHDNEEVFSDKVDEFEDCIITPIPTKPNYQPGDLVTILPIVREVVGYDDRCQEANG